MADIIDNTDVITCDVIRDLMPLAADGVASEDSVRLLERHMEHCGDCRELYDEMCNSKAAPPIAASTDDKKIIAYIRKRYVLLVALIMMIGMLFVSRMVLHISRPFIPGIMISKSAN